MVTEQFSESGDAILKCKLCRSWISFEPETSEWVIGGQVCVLTFYLSSEIHALIAYWATDSQMLTG